MPYTYIQTAELYEHKRFISLVILPCPCHPNAGQEDGPYSIEEHHIEGNYGVITCFDKTYVSQLFPDANNKMIIWYNPTTIKNNIHYNPIPGGYVNQYYKELVSGEIEAKFLGRQYVWSKKIITNMFATINPIQNMNLRNYLKHKKECACSLSHTDYQDRVFEVCLQECVDQCMKHTIPEENDSLLRI
jgi:hypothetical protein